MRSYDTIAKLKEALARFAETDEGSMYRECWLHAADIAASFETDLAAIAGGAPRVVQLYFRIRDHDYQNTDVCRALIRYDGWDDFRVEVIVLIAHGIIRVSVRKRPSDARFERIADILDVADEVHLRSYAKTVAP
ncbi:MAG: hypothetical protein ABUL66_00995 [Verrucomicrobiota bacterium]